MKKYIFVDIDGTLTNSEKKVSSKNKEAIKNIEKKDFEIVFCSGRTNNYLIDLSQQCQTSRYIISSNGSMIYDTYKRIIIHQNKIPFTILKNIYEYCEQNHMAISFNTENFRYCNKFLNYDNNYTKEDIIIIKDIKEIETKNVTQFVLGSYNYTEMTKVKDFLNTIPTLEIVNISTTMKLKQVNSKEGFFFDVVLNGINKGTGIKNFIKIFNTSKENCIAIGDHINDLDMFNAVGYKIAMDNACHELKEQANFITKSNDDDGVKYALEYLEKEVYKI